jgi:hypothetical protein
VHRRDAVFQFGGDPVGVDRFADRKRTVEIGDALSFVRTAAAAKNKKSRRGGTP